MFKIIIQSYNNRTCVVPLMDGVAAPLVHYYLMFQSVGHYQYCPHRVHIETAWGPLAPLPLLLQDLDLTLCSRSFVPIINKRNYNYIILYIVNDDDIKEFNIIYHNFCKIIKSLISVLIRIQEYLNITK